MEGVQGKESAGRVEKDYRPPAYADSRSHPETVVPPHCYFVLGDHRSMSQDSRDFGPVNQSYIYGKAVFGYWPMDKGGRGWSLVHEACQLHPPFFLFPSLQPYCDPNQNKYLTLLHATTLYSCAFCAYPRSPSG